MQKTLNDEIRINNERIHLYSSENIWEENDTKKLNCSIPIIKKKSMDIINFKKKFEQTFSTLSFNILPEKCKYFEQFGDRKIYIIEEQPSVRSIKMSLPSEFELTYLKRTKKINDPAISSYFNKENRKWSTTSFDDTKKYSLSLPYVVFIIVLDKFNQHLGTWVYFRLAPVVGKEDYLLLTPFCNIDENQQICLGSFASRNAFTEQQVIQNVINTFWHAVYNSDYTYNLKHYQKENIHGVASYVEWEIMSKKDPNFIYDVNWIAEPMKLNKKLKYIKELFGTFDYENLFQRFKSTLINPTKTDTTIIKKIGNNSVIRQSLYYDVTNGLRPRNSSEIYLHVGDPFYIKHKKAFCYISSFLGSNNGARNITYIQVERNDGKFFKYKFTERFRKFVIEQAKAVREVDVAKMNNGTTIKSKDILIFPDGTYKQIDYIRRTPFNTIEVKFNNLGFYNLDVLECKLLSVDGPIKYKDIEIMKDISYLVTFPLANSKAILFKSITMKFDSYLLSDYESELYIRMQRSDNSIDGNPFELEKNYHNILKIEETEIVNNNPIFNTGRTLHRIINNVDNENNDISLPEFIKTKEGITYNSDKYHATTNINYIELEKQIIKDKKLYITGFDIDIDFSVGDKVVVADWENLNNMLVYNEIIEFVVDTENNTLSFKLKDSFGKVSLVEYIRSSLIHIGKIRHISDSFENLKFSDKIRSRNPGISNFPKKDVNMIIGFLTDTGTQPLVLCSNSCTLWYQDVLNNFDIITNKDKSWERLNVCGPEIDKIKPQPGDLVKFGSYNYLVGHPNSDTSKRPLDESPCTYHDTRESRNCHFINFLAPRMLQKEILETKINSYLVPNLLGSYTKVKTKFNIGFPMDERSIINV